MFFVNDDDPHVLHGGKDRRTRADGDARRALPQAHPFVEPLPRGEPAVQNGGGAPEARAELAEHLGGERDLGDEEDRRPSRGESVGDEREIDFRLAASRHAVQKADRLFCLLYGLDRVLLEWGEFFRRIFPLHPAVGVAENAAFLGGEHPPVEEGLDGGAEHFAQKSGVGFPVRTHEVVQFSLPFGAGGDLFLAHESDHRPVPLGDLARPHLGGKEEAQHERHRRLVPFLQCGGEGERFPRERGPFVLGAENAFDAVGEDLRLLFHAHDESRRHPVAERHDDAHPRGDPLPAGVIEDFIDVAVRDVHDHFRKRHTLTAPLRRPRAQR